MANDLTQDEIDARQQLNEAIKQGSAEIAANGRISAATQAKLDNSTKTLTKDFDSLGSQLIKATKTFYEGTTKASDFGSSITSAANSAATYLGSKGPLGLAVGKLVQVLGKYVNAVNKQADQLFDSYQDIADAGATGARGITEVFENMQKFGYTINELGKFSAVVKANSETLAVLGGTAASGAKAFGEITKSLQYGELGEEFTRMGITVDGINTGLAGYLKIQQLSGATSKKTTAELVQSSTDYIKELDLLAKMTGQTRAGVQAQQEKALQQEQFAAYQFELRQQIAGGGTEGKMAQAQLDNVTKVYQSMANQPGIQKGFLNALTNNLTDPDTIKFMQAMPRAYAESQKKIIDINEFSISAQKDTATYLKGSGTALAKLGSADLIGPKYQEILSYNTIIAKGLKEKVEQGKTEQQVTDASTDSMAAGKVAMRDTTNNLQSLVNIGVRPVTAAMMGLNKVIRGITGVPGAIVGAVKPAASSATMLGRSGTGGAATGGVAAAASGLNARLQAGESGGRNIQNQTGSGAFGIYQIMPKTFQSLVDKAGSNNPLQGKTWEEFKKSTALQEETQRQLQDSNRNDLVKNNINPTDAAVYLSHVLGTRDSLKALRASESTAISSILSAGVLDVNPQFAKMKNVGELKAWADTKSGGGGYKFGGIATGPDTGYETTLHGTEAVVPLPNGNSIPVEMQSNSEQTGIMSAQLSRLDDIVRVMQTQLGVSQKLLQYAQ